MEGFFVLSKKLISGSCCEAWSGVGYLNNSSRFGTLMSNVCKEQGMRFRSILVFVTVLVSSTFLVSDARGQGRVQGEVTDKWGNGLGEVQIAVERTDGGGSYSATTEDDGEYIILGLQSGNYEITFTLDGYQGVRVAENVRSSAGPPLDVELEAGTSSMGSNLFDGCKRGAVSISFACCL